MKKMPQKKNEISSRSKKITVKFFLNKTVQPFMEKKIKRFPLYMLITYDRRNTMMRCHYGKYYRDLNEIDQTHYPGLLALEEKLIKKTIEYELGQQGIDFDLKGLHKKYDQYSIGIHLILEQYLKDQLWNVLLKLEPFEYAKALNFSDPDITFDTLFKITKKIYKDFATLLPKNFEREIEVYNTFLKFY